ncbi:hypothetical protein D3C78_1768010 [compost metagenome]
MGFWQKYGVSNSSWIRMICAPSAAAWRTSFSALAIFAALSQEQAIWVAATVTIRDMKHLVGALEKVICSRQRPVTVPWR